MAERQGFNAKAKVKMRLVCIVDYEADPADYGTEDPLAMARIDREQFAEAGYGEWFDPEQANVTVVPLDG